MSQVKTNDADGIDSAQPRGSPVTSAGVFDVPDDAGTTTGGRGALISRVQWTHPDGATATWESRKARKRGFIEVLRDGVIERIRARPAVAIRLGRCNTVSGISFFIGGALFTIGAIFSQTDAVSTATINWTFLVGGFFFSTGAYAALVQDLNSPHGIDSDGRLTEKRWRWWAYEPHRPGWLAAFVLFCGTLAFAISLIDAFIQTLDRAQIDHLIWAPEIVGCVLFLVSGHIGIIEVCHGRFRFLPRSLGWWIVVVNQIGSWLFFASGLAAYVRPLTGEVVSVAVINWGTGLGAACFSLAGLAQLFERPDSAPATVAVPADRAPVGDH
jgi:hypothetical protein